MKLHETVITQTLNEHHLIETLNLDNKVLLELGCGGASMTQKIALCGYNRNIIACEVDKKQHAKNLELNIENIHFLLCGAQDIKLKDNTVDMVMMFKSFHHIPKEHMSKALMEIKRVLKPNGLVYISEPLYAGQQNELISLFHDEKQVRIDAFNAIKESVEKKEFKLFRELFFQTEVSYKNFEEFKLNHIDLSYHYERITEELEKDIKARYDTFSNEDGSANFLKPFRVDILQNA